MRTRIANIPASKHAAHRVRRSPIRPLVSAATALLVVASALIPATAASAAEYTPAGFDISKSQNMVHPGAGTDDRGVSFDWIVKPVCSYTVDECVNAVLTDIIPPEFVPPAPGDILVTPAMSAADRTITVSGQTVTVEFHKALNNPVGQTGLPGGAYTVTIPVTVRSNLAYTPTSLSVENTAQISGDNAATASATDSVDLTVPLALATKATKSFSPSSNIAVGGLETQLSLGGSNSSNAPVSSLTIQDPVNVSGAQNIFRDALKLTSLDSVIWPAGATGAVVSVWDASPAPPALAGWVGAAPVAAPGSLSLPTTVDPQGIKVVFSSGATPDIERGASASVKIDLMNRSGIVEDRYPNTAQSIVEGYGKSATNNATANYEVTAASTGVTAGKSITPKRMSTIEYDSTHDRTQGTVNLTGENTGSVPLKSMTISEPSDPASTTASHNPFIADPGQPNNNLLFDGFKNGDVTWPDGADEASITYYYPSPDVPQTETMIKGDPMPVAHTPEAVTGFSVTFTSTSPEHMEHSAEAILPFYIRANSAQTDLSVDYPNEVTVTGVSVYDETRDDTAAATVTVLAEQVNLTTSKTVTRDTLRAAPGQSTIATLTTEVKDYPDSTRALTQIEMIDPSSETELTEWYKYFNATEIVATPVPVNAELKISYRKSPTAADYEPLVTLYPADSPDFVIPSSVDKNEIYGLKFEWISTTGFVPGQKLLANVKYELRSTLRDTSPAQNLPNENVAALENCSAASGTSVEGPHGETALSAVSVTSDPCAYVELLKTDPGTGGGPGAANFLDKDFSRKLLTTRSSQQTRADLDWSTGGYTGVDTMVIYDGAVDSSGNPDPQGWVNKEMYDAFDLYKIDRLRSYDSLAQYDKVVIEFYSKSQDKWVWINNYCMPSNPCDGAAEGTKTLSSAQRADFVAVQFTFSEGTHRNALGAGPGPAPGTGVAYSDGNNRSIRLGYQMRDTLRSSGSTPVVNGYEYNHAVTADSPPNSRVRNDALATATFTPGNIPLTRSDSASSILQLQDPTLGVSIDKQWKGGPTVAIPSSGQTPPTSRVILTATNESTSRVDSLTISEPNRTVEPTIPIGSPFEHWDLTQFKAINHPTGATDLTVTVTGTAGVVLQTVSGSLATAATTTALEDTIFGWGSTELAGATGFTFKYTGNIVASTKAADLATIEFDLTLRTETRTGAHAIDPGTDDNSTKATVADRRWDSTEGSFYNAELSDYDDAHLDLVSTDISVTTSKTFGKTPEVEPQRSKFQLTLKATPGGSERVKELTITDDRATFWNAFSVVTGATIDQLVLPEFSSPGGETQIKIDVCINSHWASLDFDVGGAPASNCAYRGGTWEEGVWQNQADARSTPFPAAITDVTQIEGIRLKIKRVGDSQWENPHAPKIEIPIPVQRRENLRTGDPVLTDLVGNAPSPGEPTAGTTTNSLRADVLGIWGETDTATNSATYQYKHEPSAVEVKKGPSGVKHPGQTFDYTLRVKNTGGWPIVNPVITDKPPVDGGGAQLIFDPDKPVTYNYALSGAAAPSSSNGPALPTGTSGPTVDVVLDAQGNGPAQIQFTFPAGSVLEVGQVYTITIPMMFRPGLVNGTEVENWFSIRGDRPFDEGGCETPAGSAFDAEYDKVTGECSTRTIVRPTQEPALRANMTVKANLDSEFTTDLGFNDGGTSVDCAAEAAGNDGFSRLPCVPLTLPGQKETWRLSAQNTGTTNMPRLVLSTRLPDTGDVTIVKDLIRDSEWRPGFADEITSAIGIPDHTMTIYYTTALLPCKDVLYDPMNADACGSNPTTGWVQWTKGDLLDPTVVTGLQFVIGFDEDHLFKPGDLMTIDIVTRTAALSATPGADTTANNSVSASARSRKGSNDVNVTPFDASLVSVALATGGLRLEKDITGPAASFIPDGQTFKGKLVCTSLDETLERDFTMTVDTGTTPPTVPVLTFDNLPGGADCYVTETIASGQTGYTSSTVTIDPTETDPGEFPMVTLTNDYQFAGLEVSKNVTTSANVDPNVIPTEYAFTVECTFLGQNLDLGVNASFTLDDTDSRTITGIPVNSDCIVTETDPKGADATIMSATTDSTNHPDSSVVVDNTARTATFTRLSPSDANGVTNTAEADNRFDADAALVITKKLLGDGSAQFGSHKTFTVDVLCTFEGTTQYDDPVLLNAGNGWQKTLENIIAGSDCTFTESGLQGADAVVITPHTGTATTVGTVTVPARTAQDPSPVVNIDVTNWYLTGSVEVTKTFAGDAGAIDKFARVPNPAIEFEFTLSCVRHGENVVIPGGATRTVTAATLVANYTGLASGADCTLAETRTGGASMTRILDEQGDEVVDGEFTVTVDATKLSATDQKQPDLDVENTYRFAKVAAAKRVIDTGADSARSKGPFELTLRCTLDGRDIDALETSTQSIRSGETATWTELAEGADCTIVESVTGGATRTTTTLTRADGSTGPSVIGVSVPLLPLRWTGAAAPNLITFTNSFSLAYTGSSVNVASLLLAPIGLLLFGGLLIGFGVRRRRGDRGPATTE